MMPFPPTMLRGLPCLICAAPAGQCACYMACLVPGCCWSFQRGQQCPNPRHKLSARRLAMAAHFHSRQAI
jgi:hypothetical protein